jgi:hypothetical protein
MVARVQSGASDISAKMAAGLHFHKLGKAHASDGCACSQMGCHWKAEMGRIYRLALNGRIPSDEMTRLIFALKEIRCCVEAEILTDVQQRLVMLSRDVESQNGRRLPHQPTFPRS